MHTRYTSRKTTLVCVTAHALSGNRGSARGILNGRRVRLGDFWRLEGKCSLGSSRVGVNPRGRKDGSRLDCGGIGIERYRGMRRCRGGGRGARGVADWQVGVAARPGGIVHMQVGLERRPVEQSASWAGYTGGVDGWRRRGRPKSDSVCKGVQYCALLVNSRSSNFYQAG